MFGKNTRFIGLKLPDVINPETLEWRYTGKLSNKALNLMQGMLLMDPNKRFTAIECLTHSYFDDLRLNDIDFLRMINDEQPTEITEPTQLIVRPI